MAIQKARQIQKLSTVQVFSQRLEDEYDAQVLVTTPSVPYKLKLRDISHTAKVEGKTEIEVKNPADWPETNEVLHYYEPMIKGEWHHTEIFQKSTKKA